MDIRSKAIKGVTWTSLSTIVSAGAQLIQLAVLARFLEPELFGLLSIITMVIGFSQMFADLGISSAIIHKQNTSNSQLSTLYWLNIITSIGIYLLILLLSTPIAVFYNNPELSYLIPLTSTTIIIQAFGKQFSVLFQKEMEFNKIAKIEITGAILGLALAIVLAYYGMGIYALIYPLIATTTVKTVLFFNFGRTIHTPQFTFKLNEVKEFIRFGFFQMGSGIINYFNSQFDIMIIGKVFGSEILGLYSISKQFIMRPSQAFNPIVVKVAFPAMAKLQGNTERLKEIYLKTIHYVSMLNFPIYIAIIVMAPQIVHIFLGENWSDAIPLFRVLSLYALLRSTGNPVGALVLAKGKPQYEFYWNLALFIYMPIWILISTKFDILGVTWGLVLLMLIGMIPNWHFLVKKLSNAGFVEYFSKIAKPFLYSSVTGVVTYYCLQLLPPLPDIIELTAGAAIGGILLLLSIYIFEKGSLDSFIRKRSHYSTKEKE